MRGLPRCNLSKKTVFLWSPLRTVQSPFEALLRFDEPVGVRWKWVSSTLSCFQASTPLLPPLWRGRQNWFVANFLEWYWWGKTCYYFVSLILPSDYEKLFGREIRLCWTRQWKDRYLLQCSNEISSWFGSMSSSL